MIHERCAGDEVLLLACDGLWDVLNNDEAINKIREIFANGGNVMTKVAEDMLTYSLEKGTHPHFLSTWRLCLSSPIYLTASTIYITFTDDAY